MKYYMHRFQESTIVGNRKPSLDSRQRFCFLLSHWVDKGFSAEETIYTWAAAGAEAYFTSLAVECLGTWPEVGWFIHGQNGG